MKKNAFFIFTVFFLALFLCSCGAKSTDELLKKAMNSAQKNEWKSSLKYAQKAHEQSPNEAMPLLMLIIAEEHNEMMDEAITNAMRATEKYPDSFLAQYLLGSIYCHQGKYERAIRPLTIAETIKPTDINTLILLGKAKLVMGADGAERCYSKLAKFSSNADKDIIYNQIAICLALKNQPRKALEIQNAAKNSTNPVLFMNKGIINDYYLGNIPEARSAYNQFVELAQGRKELEAEYKDIQNRLNEIKNW